MFWGWIIHVLGYLRHLGSLVPSPTCARLWPLPELECSRQLPTSRDSRYFNSAGCECDAFTVEVVVTWSAVPQRVVYSTPVKISHPLESMWLSPPPSHSRRSGEKILKGIGNNLESCRILHVFIRVIAVTWYHCHVAYMFTQLQLADTTFLLGD